MLVQEGVNGLGERINMVSTVIVSHLKLNIFWLITDLG